MFKYAFFDVKTTYNRQIFIPDVQLHTQNFICRPLVIKSFENVKKYPMRGFGDAAFLSWYATGG